MLLRVGGHFSATRRHPRSERPRAEEGEPAVQVLQTSTVPELPVSLTVPGVHVPGMWLRRGQHLGQPWAGAWAADRVCSPTPLPPHRTHRRLRNHFCVQCVECHTQPMLNVTGADSSAGLLGPPAPAEPRPTPGTQWEDVWKTVHTFTLFSFSAEDTGRLLGPAPWPGLPSGSTALPSRRL